MQDLSEAFNKVPALSRVRLPARWPFQAKPGHDDHGATEALAAEREEVEAALEDALEAARRAALAEAEGGLVAAATLEEASARIAEVEALLHRRRQQLSAGREGAAEGGGGGCDGIVE